MPRDTRNRLHIYYIEKHKEKHVIVYPKSICGNKTNWRDFNYSMAYDLYNQGITEVCKTFDVLVPEDIALRYEWCWDSIPHPSLPDAIEEKNKIRNTDEYKLYKDLWIESHIREITESMFNEAYRNIKMACLYEYGSDELKERNKLEKDDTYKSYFDLNYLFYDMLGNQDTNMEHNGCWIMRDGSYISVGTAHHNRFLQDYLGYKEWDMERYWVKISLGTAHIHDRLTNQQWETVNKLQKKYNLTLEKLGDW